MKQRDADAIVVGAGPAGSAAAFFLAGHGRRVLLLDKRRFPRDKACGDGVTRPGVRVIKQMGALDALADAQRYDGLRVHVRGRSRDFRTAGEDERRPDRGLVVPRVRLDELLCRTAAERGADLGEEWEASELLMSDGRVAGVRVKHGGRTHALRAPFVVCADGATAGLARKAELLATPRDAIGYAIRGYYRGLHGLESMLEFYIPITDPADRYLLPSYGWVFPTGPGEANVGVGISFRAHGVNVRRLCERFVAALGESEPRFSEAELEGQWRGAPVRSDFTADRCQAPGVLLVGDAAGLVSPFTGEGIAYGLESGELAADSIHRALDDGGAEFSDGGRYVAGLRRRYSGYFETGHETVQRYELAFRVLESTYEDDRPLFSLWRRAALLPEGLGVFRSSDLVDDVADLVEPITARLRADLSSVDEVIVRTVQHDWPFLARFGASVERDAVPARPATLLLMCAYLGRPPGQKLVELAAAAELSYFAALSHAGLQTERPGDEPHTHWGNMFAILAGNFQLAKALELSSRVGTDAIARVTSSVSDLCEGRVHGLRRTCDLEIAREDYVDVLARTSGRSFEAICDLGGFLGGIDEEAQERLRDYGRHLGVAHSIAEEIVSVAGGPAIGASAPDEALAGRVVLPVAIALRDPDLGPMLRGVLTQPGLARAQVDDALARVAASAAQGDAFKLLEQHATAAAEAAAGLPACDAREALKGICEQPSRRAQSYLPGAVSPTAPVRFRGGGRNEGDAAWSLPQRLGVAADVERLRDLLELWRENVEGDVREMVDYQLCGPSKYFRPATVFACYRARCDQPPTDGVLRAAAAVELFHNATLIVDDIVDRDAQRRGKAALHRRFGRARGLATGFYLTFGAARLIAEDGETCRALDELGKRIVVAECRQWRLRRHALGLDTWRELAGEDTGVMFQMSARVAVPDGTLDRFGYLLGTLYHGCDDIADVRGATALGGGREKDITDRILTLPAALALRDPAAARLFEEGGSEADDALAARYAEALPEAEAVLDGVAREAEQEVIVHARHPERLIDLIRYTRTLSRA